MDAQNFLEIVRRPEAWYDKATQLRRTGDLVWETYAQESDFLAQMGYLSSASMLYAMALEAAMKGQLVESKPEDLRFTVETDGMGTIRSASIRKLGVTNHDLVALADSLGLIGVDKGRRQLLQGLTECLVWIARYPVPIGVSSEKQTRDTVAIFIQNTSVRQMIDELLDELLRPGKEGNKVP